MFDDGLRANRGDWWERLIDNRRLLLNGHLGTGYVKNFV